MAIGDRLADRPAGRGMPFSAAPRIDVRATAALPVFRMLSFPREEK
jgi:hypothetical protein